MKTSLIAAQISSVLTVMTPSTSCWHRSKHTSPTCLTATPSANPSTLFSLQILPWWRDCSMALAPSGSTPITFTSGRMDLMYAAIPEMRPPPPTGTNTYSTLGSWRTTSMPTVPWPATTSGSSNGGTKVLPSSSALRLAYAWHAS